MRNTLRPAAPRSLPEKPFECHPEEPQATKDLRSSLKLQLRGFFALLRMTEFKGFSAACRVLDRSARRPNGIA